MNRQQILDDFMHYELLAMQDIKFSKRFITVSCVNVIDFTDLSFQIRQLQWETNRKINRTHLLSQEMLFMCFTNSYGSPKPFKLNGMNADSLEYVFLKMDYKECQRCEIDVNNCQDVRLIFYK